MTWVFRIGRQGHGWALGCACAVHNFRQNVHHRLTRNCGTLWAKLTTLPQTTVSRHIELPKNRRLVPNPLILRAENSIMSDIEAEGAQRPVGFLVSNLTRDNQIVNFRVFNRPLVSVIFQMRSLRRYLLLRLPIRGRNRVVGRSWYGP